MSYLNSSTFKNPCAPTVFRVFSKISTTKVVVSAKMRTFEIGGIMSEIKVVDSIMGSGKTCAAINYMRSHPREKFIFITPYLEEVARIREACPEHHFREPKDTLPEYGFRKSKHMEALLHDGENIVGTHSLLLRCQRELVESIQKYHYTLFLDESVEILRPLQANSADIKLLREFGALEYKDGKIVVNIPPTYDGTMAKPLMPFIGGNNLVDIGDEDENGCSLYYWEFDPDILRAFDRIFVLTYMFDSQVLKHYFDLFQMPYETIGVAGTYTYDYHFDENGVSHPEYVKDLSKLIHIFENAKLNRIGDHKGSLSATWYKTSATREKKECLRKNVGNYFINYHRDKCSERRLWASYKNGEKFIRAKGFWNANIPFNARSSNDYRQCDVLAYTVNVYMRPAIKIYLAAHGVKTDEDRYALSVMLQWIWRSAIRDGKEIWIYIPSKRMRTLLKNWIKETEDKYREKEGCA